MSKPRSGLFLINAYFENIKKEDKLASRPVDPPYGPEKKVRPLKVAPTKTRSKKGRDLLAKAKDCELRDVIAELYRPGASIGDGGTADAIRIEKKTGKLVGGKSHIMKGRQRLKNLEGLLKRKDLSDSDREIAKQLYDDLKNALGDK